jgi:hypothetical protein
MFPRTILVILARKSPAYKYVEASDFAVGIVAGTWFHELVGLLYHPDNRGH